MWEMIQTLKLIKKIFTNFDTNNIIATVYNICAN